MHSAGTPSAAVPHPTDRTVSRRDLLTAAAAALAVGPLLAGNPPQTPPGGGGSTGGSGSGAGSGSAGGHGAKPARPAASQPAAPRPKLTPPWWMRSGNGRSRVVEVNSRLVMRSSVVDVITLGDMVQQGLMSLTGAKDIEHAWRGVLETAKRLVIKFNAVGAEPIATNAAFARVLVDQLTQSGFDPADITLVEAPAHLGIELGTLAPVAGWADEIRVGSGQEALARYLVEADAVINVPVLKSHQIAGLSGCLKNISHAVIRHPGRYHANGCAPFVGEIVGAEKVSRKLKLNLLSGLRIVADHGPDAAEADIATMGAILMGFDPVAVDSIGLGLLSVERRRRGLDGFSVPHLLAAGADGVGRWHPADIEHIALGVEP